MAETTLFSEGVVSVSSTRFVVGTTTYPLAGVTAVSSTVKLSQRGPSAVLALMFGYFSFVMFWYGVVPERSNPWGMLLGSIGLYFAYRAIFLRDQYIIRMATSGGQQQALASSDPHYIARVTVALNDAIMQRG